MSIYGALILALVCLVELLLLCVSIRLSQQRYESIVDLVKKLNNKDSEIATQKHKCVILEDDKLNLENDLSGIVFRYSELVTLIIKMEKGEVLTEDEVAKISEIKELITPIGVKTYDDTVGSTETLKRNIGCVYCEDFCDGCRPLGGITCFDFVRNSTSESE